MIDEYKEEQASLYALGLLDDKDLSGFETQLRISSELVALVTSLQNIVACLALLAPECPASHQLRSRVFESTLTSRIEDFPFGK